MEGKYVDEGFWRLALSRGASPAGVKEGKRGKGYEMKSGLYFIF